MVDETTRLRKEIDTLVRSQKQNESENAGRDVKLNRANEEVERVKALFSKAQGEFKVLYICGLC
jgi:hypothetical protein